jgi:hypothetical protein
MREYTRSSENTDPQLLLESGPMLLRDFNPKGVLRFSGRKCVTCGNEIMDHWLRNHANADIRGRYWCTRDGEQFSDGITECVFDVPERVLQFDYNHAERSLGSKKTEK